MNIKQILQDTTQATYDVTALVVDMHRTSEGLNLFVIDDGSARIKLTKFKPHEELFTDINKDDVVKVQFTKKEYKGDLQGDPITMVKADEAASQALKKSIEEQKSKQYHPKDETLLIDTENFKQLKPSLLKAATEIRKAIFNKRPIHISHHADCDGFSAGIPIERAITAAIQHYFPEERMIRNYISRHPSKTPWYDLSDASRDVGTFAQQTQRHGVAAPLVLILDNGSTKQDLLAIEKVKLFGADVVVVDHHDPGDLDEQGKSLVCHQTLAHVNPHLLGVSEGLSASMLCYQLAYYIFRHEQPSVFVAALGGVDDRCEDEEINQMITKSGYDREYIAELGDYVNFEIYQLRGFYAVDSIIALMYGEDNVRDTIITTYRGLFNDAKEEIIKTIEHYHEKEQLGTYQVYLLNGEDTTIRGDYFTVGKYANLLHDFGNEDHRVSIVYSNSMLVFRAQENIGVDVNQIIKQLQEVFPYARISGGGHAVAGSVRFIPLAQKEILQKVKEILQNL